MRKQPRPTADAVPAAVGAPTASIESLVANGRDLKGELVAFAKSPRFSKQLTARLRSAADPHGYLDENTAVLTIDHFALQHRLPDGRTVLERFVAQRRPPLSDDECEMLLGWRDVVEGCFEVCRLDQSAVELHNLLDDLVYRVYSNMGRRAFIQLRKGMFVIGRLVPVHPATDAWLVSGHFTAFPKSVGRQIAQSALQTLTAHPELLRRNPDKLRRAWEVQAEDRADFIALFGADLVVLSPDEAQDKLREHYRRRQQKAVAALKGKAAKRAKVTGPTPEEMGRLPEELLEADDIALVYDEVEGLTYYRDFGRLDALFADPALAGDRTYLRQLREYLQDESVSPLAICRLVQRHPEGADPVFRTLLRKPGFSWQRDGEKLLRRRKKTFFDHEPTPSIATVGDRLVELLHTGR